MDFASAFPHHAAITAAVNRALAKEEALRAFFFIFVHHKARIFFVDEHGGGLCFFAPDFPDGRSNKPHAKRAETDLFACLLARQSLVVQTCPRAEAKAIFNPAIGSPGFKSCLAMQNPRENSHVLDEHDETRTRGSQWQTDSF